MDTDSLEVVLITEDDSVYIAPNNVVYDGTDIVTEPTTGSQCTSSES